MDAVGLTVPQWYKDAIVRNKIQIVLGAHFIGSTIGTNLVKTGAFEVFYNAGRGAEVIFSKLGETERML